MNMFSHTLSRRRAIALLCAIAPLFAAPASAQILVSFPGDSGASNGFIRNYAPNGTYTTLASGISAPQGLAFSGTDLYVALNQSNGTFASIAKIAPNGSSTVFSSSTGGTSTIGLAFDSSGNLYGANSSSSGNGTIVKFGPGGGAPTTVVASTGTSSNTPYGIALDGAGNIYAAIRNNHTIVSYNSSGGTNWTTSLAGGSSPFGLALNGTTLYVANSSANTIDMYSTVNGSSLGNFANASDGLSGPYGLAFSGGTLYVANNGGTSINMFTAAHTSTSFSTGGAFPAFIAVSAIPEPSTYAAIAGAAMLGLAIWHRRRRSSANAGALGASSPCSTSS